MPVVAQGRQRGLDVGLERGARVSAAGDDVAVGGAELDRVEGGDDRAEGVAEEDEAVEPEGLREAVDILGEDFERQGSRDRRDRFGPGRARPYR